MVIFHGAWGVSFNITPQVSVFVDYTQLFDGTIGYIDYYNGFEDDITVDTWNIGINYKF